MTAARQLHEEQARKLKILEQNLNVTDRLLKDAREELQHSKDSLRLKEKLVESLRSEIQQLESELAIANASIKQASASSRSLFVTLWGNRILFFLGGGIIGGAIAAFTL